MRGRAACGVFALLCAFASTSGMADDKLVVGSKRFTESYILGEIVARTAREHAPAHYRSGLGNTGSTNTGSRALAKALGFAETLTLPYYQCHPAEVPS